MKVVLTAANTTLCVVSRQSQSQFLGSTLLGMSLSFVPPGLLPNIRGLFDNAGTNITSLPDYYNSVLSKAGKGQYLIFVHDDVYIHDWFFLERLQDAFRQFDVVGVAGNTAADWLQPSWMLKFDSSLSGIGVQDRSKLSGAISHGHPNAPSISHFGPTPAACDVVDGVFLAINVSRIQKAGLGFDPRFRFHAYDLDFCRAARNAGLRVGTWPIALTHASGGNFTSAEWKHQAGLYLEKWRKP